jgi:hypothetical protein
VACQSRKYFSRYAWANNPSAEKAVPVLTHRYCQAHMTPPDGDWWRKVQLHCAARDGDEAAVATMRQDEERARAKWRAAGNALLRKFNPGMTAALLKAVAEQLPLAAGELRELALENDPDAMRDGLIELATKGVGRAVPLTVVEVISAARCAQLSTRAPPDH